MIGAFLILGMTAVLPALLDRIRGSYRERQNRIATSYLELVESLADGNEPKPIDVEKILDAAGKSIDELADDVKKLEDRRQDAAAEQQVEVARSRMREIADEIEQRRAAAWEAYQAELATLEPLQREHRECERTVQTGAEARSRLIRSFSDSDALGHEKALREENYTLHLRRKELEKSLELFDAPHEWQENPNHEYGEGLFAQWLSKSRKFRDARQRYEASKNSLDPRVQQAIKTELTAAENAFATIDNRVKYLRTELAQNLARKAEIATELDAIEAQKLVP